MSFFPASRGFIRFGLSRAPRPAVLHTLAGKETMRVDNDLGGAAAAAPYDYRRYDRIWQRVAPSLSPYPGALAVPAAAVGSVLPAEQETAPAGAAGGTCCMGPAAGRMLGTLEGYIEDELADHRYYLAMAQQSPGWARQAVREMALDEMEHARRLMAVCYLISGRCYRPSVSDDRLYIGAWCPALRERYHAEVCGGGEYLRAAEAAGDPCLKKILSELSAEEYGHADALTALLERSLSSACTGRGIGV